MAPSSTSMGGFLSLPHLRLQAEAGVNPALPLAGCLTEADHPASLAPVSSCGELSPTSGWTTELGADHHLHGEPRAQPGSYCWSAHLPDASLSRMREQATTGPRGVAWLLLSVPAADSSCFYCFFFLKAFTVQKGSCLLTFRLPSFPVHLPT